MTVYLAGSEGDIFDTFAGAATTNALVTISGENRAGVVFLGSSQNSTATFQALTEGWVHFRFGRSGTTGVGAQSQDFLRLRNAEGQNLFKLTCSSTTTVSTYTILSQSAVSTGVSSGIIDVNFKIAETDGFVRVWLNNVLVTQFNGDTRLPSGTQSISNLYASGINSASINFSAFFSQFLVSDMPTVGSRVVTLPLTVSAVNDWDGTVTNVTGTDVSGIDNAIKEQVIDQRIRFDVANVASIASNEFIGSVSMSASALAELGSSVTKIGWIAFDGATEVEAATSGTLLTTFSGNRVIMNTNPITTAAWDLSELNTIELGMKAKA